MDKTLIYTKIMKHDLLRLH